MPYRVQTEYHKEYQRIAMIRSRTRLKRRCVEYKGGICADCGGTFALNVYEFHHPDPSAKEFEISRTSSVTRRFEKLIPELDKVVLLCANCHRMVHFKWNKERLDARISAFHAMDPPEGVRKLYVPSADVDPRRKGQTKVLVEKEDAVPYFQPIDQPTKPCATCGTPTTNYKFCKLECSSDSKLKAAWPSDEELHKLLWERPATKVAEELGVSSVAVKKRCKLRSIPTPPRGYWAKLLKVSPSR